MDIISITYGVYHVGVLKNAFFLKHFARDLADRIDFAVNHDHIAFVQRCDAFPLRLLAIIPLRMASEIRAAISVCVYGIRRVCDSDQSVIPNELLEVFY